MFSPLLRWITTKTGRIPFVKDVDFNFILAHYVWIISWTILCSIIIFPGSNLHYIDALFFGSGAATQSGLNTVDLNLLHLYQQIVLYMTSMCTTPIFIHTGLVFVRLYWFEKRFQRVVQDAREMRRTRSRVQTFSESKNEPTVDREERGVRNRSIVVLRNPMGEVQGEEASHPVAASSDDSKLTSDGSNGKIDSSGSLEGTNGNPANHLGLDVEGLRVPQQLTPEHHIAFLEKQRKTEGALRIPSPREYDRGGVPQALDEDEGDMGGRQPESGRRPSDESERSESNEESPGASPDESQHITIAEPDMARARMRVSTFPRMESRPTFRETKENQDEPYYMRDEPRRGAFSKLFRSLTREQEKPTLPYLSWNATVGRNSHFVDLTEEQRNELGGIEYRALKTLALVLVSYYAFFHIFGMISLMGWIMTEPHWGSVVRADGVGRPWWAIFTAETAFNNVGFTLTPDSMASFQYAVWPLLLMTYLIAIGNTGFPCMLRFIIFCLEKITPKTTAFWEELKFLLDHPRRCFTLLFPRNATWWLFVILVILNGLDLIFFIVLDLNDPAVTSLPPGIRVVNGLFQAASTRTAGTSTVGVSSLHPAVQVSYMIMMYISVFPIAISMRRTNVYEEKSLGIYSSEEKSDETMHAPSYIGFHLRRQLGFDLWFLALGLFIITIAESPRIQNVRDYGFQIWNVLFECVSAYGTVGLSMGYPGINASFSAEFSTVSKLVIIVLQIRGRHRGLPYAVDRAIMLPSESLHDRDREEEERRMRRRPSNISNISAFSRPLSQTSSTRRDAGYSTGVDPRDQGRSPTQPLNRDSIVRRQSSYS